MYADYAFYQGAYHGALITAEEWPRLCTEASAYVDKITYGRLKRGWEVTDAVRMATCAVAEVIQQQAGTQAARAAGVKAENVDGYSVTYDGLQAALCERDMQRADAAGQYLLLSDPLRYAGVY